MPAIDMLEGLRIENARSYFDVYNFDGTPVTDNPLKPFTPFANDENLPLPFFGPFVFNAVIMTAPWVQGDLTWDTAAVDRCKEVITNAYDSFSRYELHFFIDSEAPDITNEDNADALAAAEALFGGLGMEEYGISFWGQLTVGEIEIQIRSLLTAYYTFTSEN